MMTNSLINNFVYCSTLHLLSAYLQLIKMNNKFKAIYQMIHAQNNEPNILIEFSLFKLKLQIYIYIYIYFFFFKEKLLKIQ